MKFGTINNFLLLGGGQTLFEYALYLKESGRAVTVITSRRHANNEVIAEDGSRNFLDALRTKRIKTTVCVSIESDSAVDALITSTTLGVSIGAEWVFKQAFIEKFHGRLVNIHGSDLPMYRGGGGVSWMILAGVRKSASTIHLVDPDLDTGHIVFKSKYTFPDNCITPKHYSAFAISQHMRLLIDFCQKVDESQDFQLEKQDAFASTYWPRLNTLEHGFIDWSWTARDICQFVCAFDDPYQGASSYLRDARVFLKGCKILQHNEALHPFQSGIVFRKTDTSITVAAIGAVLEFDTVNYEDASSAIKDIRPGDRLYVTQDKIDLSKKFRAFYKP